jgi:predicted dehydrogenase
MSSKHASRGNAMTRRRFCAAAAMAPAAAMSFDAVAASAAEPEKTSAGGGIKVGIVGLGHRGKMIGRLCRDHGGYEITAVADYFEHVAEKVGAEFAVPEKMRFAGLSGYKRVLDSGVDVLLVMDVPYFYPEQAAAAVVAGCHVYMAKPVAVDVPGVTAIRKAAAEAAGRKLVFHVDYQLPTDPANRQVAQRVRDGALGKLAHILSGGTGGPWKDPQDGPTIENLLENGAWLSRVSLGGDDIVSYDIHIIDGVTWVTRKSPVSACGASGVARRRNGDSTDFGGVVFRYDDGTVWTHVTQALKNNSWINNLGADLMGVSATARVSYWGKVHVRGGAGHYSGAVSDSIYDDGARANVAEFYRCITEGDFSNPTAERAVDGTLTAILGREAMARGGCLARDGLVRENKKLEVDLRGLKA